MAIGNGGVRSVTTAETVQTTQHRLQACSISQAREFLIGGVKCTQREIDRHHKMHGHERAKHFDELYQILGALLKHRTTNEWLEMFDKADIPAMPVRTLEELLDDPHLRATGFFTEREHPTEGPITTFASPLDFEKTKVEFRRHAPGVGGDGEEVLREAGVSDKDIERLKNEGILIVP